MADDLRFNRFITDLANEALRTQAMSQRAKSKNVITIVGLQTFLNMLMADSPHLGRADSWSAENPGSIQNFVDRRR
jgi:hypothetical protein